MGQFSIKDIESLTGIKSHTIRIWEQRYNLLEPARTASNIRYYSDADLRTILNVNILYTAGNKISKIAQLTKKELEDNVRKLSTQQASTDIQLQGLISAMLAVNENAMESILLKSFASIGIENTVEKLVFPFLKHIGLLWQSGTIDPAFEHFISQLIRRKLIGASENLLNTEKENCLKFLLFLPAGETHEMGLLLGDYMIRKAGHRSLFLGSDLPHEDLSEFVGKYQPDFIFCSATSGLLPSSVKDIAGFLCKEFQAQKILLTGSAFIAEQPELGSNGTYIFSSSDLAHFLA